jgi:hypothetical protein
MVHVGRQTMFVIAVLILVLLSLWRFVALALVVLGFGFVVCVGVYLVRRMNHLEDVLDEQRALLGAARREIAGLRQLEAQHLVAQGHRQAEVDLRDCVPAEYLTSRTGPAGEPPEWADTTWPGRSRYS